MSFAMILLDFFRYLKGNVSFEATGAYLERFMNLCARERVPVWDCKRNSSKLKAKTDAKSYKRLRPLAKKTGIKLRITGKAGAPFTRRRYRHRYGIPVGIGIFLVFLFTMSQFIWNIEIVGLQTIPHSHVLQALEELNFGLGTPRAAVDVRDLERRTIIKIPEISWIAINIDGSSVVINISERTPPPQAIDQKSPCNIVAAQSGLITAINVYEGEGMVSVGDTVLEGSMLISGITEDSFGKNLFRHARGEVFARFMVQETIEVPFVQLSYKETGEIKKRNYLECFGITMPMFLNLGKIDGIYHVEREEKPFAIFGIETGLKVCKEKYIIMQETEETLTEYAVKEKALRELQALEKIEYAKAQIMQRELNSQVQNGVFILTATYDLIADIAMQKEISVANTANDTQ